MDDQPFIILPVKIANSISRGGLLMAWRYYFGIFLLAIGIGYLIEQMQFIAGFQFVMVLQAWWPLVIVGAGINQFVRHKDQPWGSLIVFAMGIVLLAVARDQIPMHSPHGSWKPMLMGSWKLVLSILLTSLAMRMMVPRRIQQFHSSAPGIAKGAKVRFEHAINSRQIFGSTNFRNDSQQFLGGTLSAIMGDYELDLRGASLAAKGADLRIQSIFGTVRVLVPPQMVLDVSGLPVLAGIENSAHQIVSKEDGLPVLKIHYFAIFGAVEIRN
jgi:hypothetical protein